MVPEKNRINSDIIEFFFQEDSSMDLASRLIWNLSPELHADTKFNRSRFCVKLQIAVLNFCHFTTFFPIIMLSAVLSFFCQIIMGSPLNNNVPEGRSMSCGGPWLWHYRLWRFQGRDTKLERFLHENQL